MSDDGNRSFPRKSRCGHRQLPCHHGAGVIDRDTEMRQVVAQTRAAASDWARFCNPAKRGAGTMIAAGALVALR
jgi:hypothetical protein